MLDEVIVTPPPPVPPASEPAPTARPKPLVGRVLAVLAAIASGLVMLVAFPTYDQWWAAPIGVALLAVATYRRGFWSGFGLGLLSGLALLVPLLSWAGGYVGSVWLILPGAFAFYFALLGGLSAVVSPVADRWRWTWPLLTGTLWVLQEALRDRTPFGGFPWGRLAFSQDDSPLLRLAVLGGAPLVTFGVAALGGLLVWALIGVRRAEGGWPRRLRALIPAGAALVLLWTPLLVPASAGDGHQVHVAIIQGNVPRLGLEFNAQRRAVLDNHVNATILLADQVKAGLRPQPDFVVWPENASDIDPIINADARVRINEAANAIGVPILVGGLLQGPGPKDIRNVGIVWKPGTGPGDSYAKRHPVPFAEYIPLRKIARMITDKVDLVRTDFVAGTTPGVLPIDGATVGDVICFEVAYDDVVRDVVANGAQIIVVQTNNATFNEQEARQQMAMVRLRAVEHGRSALMASTVGISGFVDADGSLHEPTGFNERAIVVRDVELGDGRTMATVLGPAPELALVVAALAFVVLAIVVRRRPSGVRDVQGNREEVVG